MTGDRREGRGRLSSLDMLPEEAEPDIAWALDALNERSMPQVAILAEFNARLADRGIAGVSKSSFSRWSVRKAMQLRKLNDARSITNDIFASIGTAGAEETTMVLVELVKAQVFEILENGKLATKDIRALATSLRDLANANRASAEHRRRLEESTSAAVEAVVDRAEEAMRDAGIPGTRIKQMREEFLGVRKPSAA